MRSLAIKVIEQRWLSLAQVAAIVGCSPRQVQRYRNDGTARFPKPRRDGRELRFAESEVLAWCAARQRRAN